MAFDHDGATTPTRRVRLKAKFFIWPCSLFDIANAFAVNSKTTSSAHLHHKSWRRFVWPEEILGTEQPLRGHGQRVRALLCLDRCRWQETQVQHISVDATAQFPSGGDKSAENAVLAKRQRSCRGLRCVKFWISIFNSNHTYWVPGKYSSGCTRHSFDSCRIICRVHFPLGSCNFSKIYQAFNVEDFYGSSAALANFPRLYALKVILSTVPSCICNFIGLWDYNYIFGDSEPKTPVQIKSRCFS